MSKGFRFQPGDPFTVECARKGAAAGGFKAGCPRSAAIARMGHAASPLGQHPIPLNHNAQRTIRLELIKRAARKTP